VDRVPQSAPSTLHARPPLRISCGSRRPAWKTELGDSRRTLSPRRISRGLIDLKDAFLSAPRKTVKNLICEALGEDPPVAYRAVGLYSFFFFFLFFFFARISEGIPALTALKGLSHSPPLPARRSLLELTDP